MAEAVILDVIQRLESWVIKMPETVGRHEETVRDIFDDLRMLSDFVRDNKPVQGSRLSYLIGDVFEMAQEILDLSESDFQYAFTYEMSLTRDWLRETRMRITNLGVEGGGDINAGEFGDEEDVVGLEEEMKQFLRKAIFNKEESLSTLLVKGMAGIGKTTLARQVYNHEAIVDRFKHRAWVSLSSGLGHKEMLMNLIQQVVGSEELERDSLLEKMECADNQSLREMLCQRLQGMPYFIVVENPPKQTHSFKSILKGLPVEDKGSRLLLTSRFENLAQIADYTHEMKPLDPDKSWQLFLKTIRKFTNGEQYEFPKHLEKKGREMLTKCGGLPVAVIDVAKEKAKQRLEKGIEWEELLEFDPNDLVASLELLESSFRELDKDLQACFLYLAFFKENATIKAQRLEQIWAGGGLDNYLCVLQLNSESFLEIVDMNIYNYIRSVRVNALLHRLAIKVAEEDMGLEIISCHGNNRPSQSSRHLVINCSRDEFNHSMDEDNEVVSLIFHGGGYLNTSPSYWKSFELLTILDLEDFGLKTLSETIGTLMELKYIGLRNNYIQEIPRSLGSLTKLEVLDISQNFMVEVPDIIREMDYLCHLYMSDVICQKPLKVNEDLSTLTYISLDNWEYEGVEFMYYLRKLGIEELDENSDLSKLLAKLAELMKFDFLILRGFRFRSMPCLDELRVLGPLNILKLDGLIARLPNAGNFPPYLNNLSLVNTCLDEDPMPVLENLPWLDSLKLRNAYTGRQMVTNHNGFPKLKFMRIKELWNLRDLQIGEGAMPYLKELEIDNCPYLESLPEEIGSMIHLKELKIVTTKFIAAQIRKSEIISIITGVDISP